MKRSLIALRATNADWFKNSQPVAKQCFKTYLFSGTAPYYVARTY